MKYKKPLLVSIIGGGAIMLIYAVMARSVLIKETKMKVGSYQVSEQVRRRQGKNQCSYVATYRNKTIYLGEYDGSSGCHMTQSVVANGMLAIAAGQYTFFYNPVTDSVRKLDPMQVADFPDYAKIQRIQIDAYPTRRYFLNANRWQVMYEAAKTQNGETKQLFFVSNNAGIVFSFDPREQQ